jgi:hypothetical protein
LTAIQFPRYVHRYEREGGNQLLGSLSLLDRFTRSVTATNVRESDVSLAYALRIAGVHAHAPESHASFNATTWSMSMREGSDHREPSYGEIQSPAITSQSIGSNCGRVTLSRFNTWSRESQPSPSTSRQCSNDDLEYPIGRSRSTTIPCNTSIAGPPLRTLAVGSGDVAATEFEADKVTTTSAPFSARRQFMSSTLSAPNMVRLATTRG